MRRLRLPELMTEDQLSEKKEEGNSIHIFSVSAAMVGACLTVIGLFSISQSLKRIETLGDELVTFDAMLFLVSCIFSYMALRKKGGSRRHHLEKMADGFFLAGLSFIVLVCVLLVWKLI